MQPTTKQHADKAKDSAHSAVDSAKDAAGHVGQAASGLANQAGQAASHLASQAKDAAKDAASTVGKKAEDWTAGAGQRVENLADTLRQSGPNSGVLGKANAAVAEGIESAGHYMQDKNLSGMMGDVTELVKRNPIPALLIGLGVGYLLGKAMRS